MSSAGSVTGRIVGTSDEIVDGNVEVIRESAKTFNACRGFAIFNITDLRFGHAEYR